jgi:hypothetical protein
MTHTLEVGDELYERPDRHRESDEPTDALVTNQETEGRSSGRTTPGEERAGTRRAGVRSRVMRSARGPGRAVASSTRRRLSQRPCRPPVSGSILRWFR